MKRAAFLREMVEQMHVPYGYGFKGLPLEPYRGRDCSGAITAAVVAAGGPDWRATHNAQRLWDELQEPVVVRPGTLCFYRRPDGYVHHVMAVLYDEGSGGNGLLVIGAAGGTETTTTLSEALHRGAEVQTWKSHLYMLGFCGFRELPITD